MSIRDDLKYPSEYGSHPKGGKWATTVQPSFIVGGRSYVGLVDAGGTLLKTIDEKLRVSSMPYLYDIAEGNVPGHDYFRGFGERVAVAVVVAGVDIWRGVSNTIPIPVAAGEQLEVISTSGNDDGAPVGTGVRTVEVHYLDAAGNQQEETVIMNGLGAVALNETNVRFVNDFHTATVGTGGAAAGTITLYKQGTPLTVYARIPIGMNKGLSTQKMVPAGKVFYMTQWAATATASKPIAMRIRTTSEHGILTPGIFIHLDSAYLQDMSYVHTFDIPIQIPEFTIIKVTGYATQAGAEVSASWGGWIE